MKRLVLKQFRVRNFRNIDDSGWIPLEHVTALVGRNESGKSALLKALHKFNPGTPEPYNPQREFPRDRFMREFRSGGDWPVCSLEFELSAEFLADLRKELGNVELPTKVTCTRSYDGSLAVSYDTSVTDKPVPVRELIDVLQDFASDARRLAAPSPEQEQYTAEIRASLANWAASKTDLLNDIGDLKNEGGVALLKLVRAEANARSGPLTADLIESLLKSVEELTVRAATEPLPRRHGCTTRSRSTSRCSSTSRTTESWRARFTCHSSWKNCSGPQTIHASARSTRCSSMWACRRRRYTPGPGRSSSSARDGSTAAGYARDDCAGPTATRAPFGQTEFRLNKHQREVFLLVQTAASPYPLPGRRGLLQDLGVRRSASGRRNRAGIAEQGVPVVLLLLPDLPCGIGKPASGGYPAAR